MARITGGSFEGHEGEVVFIDGGQVTVAVEVFGRKTEVKVRRDQVELDDQDPRIAFRERILRDQERVRWGEEAGFWRDLTETPEAAALEELAAYEAHCERVRPAAEGRCDALLAAFEREVAPLTDDEVRTTAKEGAARWFPNEAHSARLKAEWRADDMAFQRYREVGEQASARRIRAGQAAFERDYAAWRAERWSQEERERLLAAVDAELDGTRPALQTRFVEDWGYALPESLFRFWRFWRSLQSCEREVMQRLELSPFGVMDLFDDPAAKPRDGLDVRVHGRFYRDPPEMLTFMHGGTDGLHFGLFYDDGKTCSGVVSYYNNDGGGLGRPRGTPLEAVRARLETSAMHTDYERNEPEAVLQHQRFGQRLLREAIQRFETGDRPEQGDAYDQAYDVPLRRADYLQDDATRFHTTDEAGARVDGEVAQPRGRHFPNTEAERVADQDRRDRIHADDPVVLEWTAEARRRLAAGDPAEALCLGRDLHWCSGGVRAREELAWELLSAAYRALGRSSLGGIVDAHFRHRDLPSVAVLRED